MMHFFFGAFTSFFKQHVLLESPLASLSSTWLNQKKCHFPPGLGTTMWADGNFSGYGSHQTAAQGVGSLLRGNGEPNAVKSEVRQNSCCFEKPLAAIFLRINTRSR